ncbi:MAG: tetratricopeptide repeat protein [Candidatus Eisenbacteria bacterium]|nr:tetratricopeptide repeat protein [Candidatus Eisenbacteria bacterium]
MEDLLDGDVDHPWVLCGGWDGPTPRTEIEQRRRYIRDLWSAIERTAAEGWDYETALGRLSIDSSFSYVKDWEPYRENGRDWVAEDHEGRMFPAFWRAHHEDGANAIAAALDGSSIEDSKGMLDEIRRNPGNRYIFSEYALNVLGYRLLGEGRAEEAIAVLRINVEKFPESWNAHDSLAEAYMTRGDREAAVRHYRESIARNPENENGREMLRRLGAL